jgi:hypothetical protein
MSGVGDRDGSSSWAAVDPLELHQAIRERGCERASEMGATLAPIQARSREGPASPTQRGDVQTKPAQPLLAERCQGEALDMRPDQPPLL